MSHISAAAPEEWHAALDLALCNVEASERPRRILDCLGLIAEGEIDPAGILVARQGADILGVQLAIPLAGASGLLWPPQVRRPLSPAPPRPLPHSPAAGESGKVEIPCPAAAETGDLQNQLVNAALDFLRARGSKVAQAILPDSAQAGPLIRGGMAPLTQLLYMQHDLTDLPPLPPLPCRLQRFDGDPACFERTLLGTYEGTLDCPELNQLRTAQEIVAGHQAQGHFRPELWQLAFSGDLPIGVVLLTVLKDSAAWDLSYLGIVPGERGRGWGRALTLWALGTAARNSAEALQLAVDVRNEPALALYRDLGFVETGRRTALFRVLGGPS